MILIRPSIGRKEATEHAVGLRIEILHLVPYLLTLNFVPSAMVFHLLLVPFSSSAANHAIVLHVSM